jgi:hypothetical protein
MSPTKTEQIKLTASWLNALSSGTLLAAIVAPYVGIAIGTVAPAADMLNLVSLSAFGFVTGLVLHLMARRMLKQLEN